MIPTLQTVKKMELWFVSYGFSKFGVKNKKNAKYTWKALFMDSSGEARADSKLKIWIVGTLYYDEHMVKI